jgi:hypothetical protein
VDTFKDRTSGLGTAHRKKQAGGPAILRQASFEDYEQISALQIRNGLTATCYEAWAALWIDNPAYHEWQADWPIGWVVQAGTGEVVGFVGNIPVAYQFRGRELRAATPFSWVVDEGYRSYSMLILERVAKQKAIDLVICTPVGPASEPSLKAFKFSKVPVGTWNESAFWITNYRGFSQSVLTWKSIPFSRIISYSVSAALFWRDEFKHVSRQLDRSITDIETCSAFDGRFDEFWYRLAHENPNVLLHVRTRETLAWHFRNALLRNSVWIVAASKGAVLTAYAIFYRQDSRALNGLKRVRLVDFQALKGSKQMLGPFLSWMLRRCGEEGIHMLEVIGCWLDRPDLPQVVAPYHRRLSSWTYYYRASNDELSETLKHPEMWAPSWLDGDASLW